jgi:hypothetical protein
MAINFDAVSSSYAPSNLLTYAHTIADELNRVLVVTVYLDAGDVDTINSITYNGDTLTYSHYAWLFNNDKMYQYYLIAPDIGTHNIVVSCSGFVTIEASSYSLYGVKQQAPESYADGVGSGDTIQGNVTTITDNALVVDTSALEAYEMAQVGSGQTSRLETNNYYVGWGISTKPVATAGATGMSWTHTGDFDDWGMLLLAWEPSHIKNIAGILYVSSKKIGTLVTESIKKIAGVE